MPITERENKKSLLIGTGNRGKAGEFRKLLKDLPLDVLFLSDFENAGEVEETGLSFEENARLKVDGYSHLLPGGWIAAEDSGLVVPALGGDPGIYSARYGNLESEEERNRLLLDRMQYCRGEERAAFYEAVIVLITPEGEDVIFRGRVHGYIADAPEGDGGFGYDPLFYHPQSGTTFACLTKEEKGKYSHRGLAALALAAYLNQETA